MPNGPTGLAHAAHSESNARSAANLPPGNGSADLQDQSIALYPDGPIEPPGPAPDLTPPPPAAGRSNAATFTRNSLLSIGRLLLSSLVALVLPAYLIRHLPVTTYSAWVLILQMSAYVGYLDFGVQTAIAKYVAEFEARGDLKGAGLRASAGLAITLATSVLGVLLTAGLAWRVPHLFRQMPPALLPDVRLSLLFVGVALSFSLICAPFSAIFLGLQRYSVPMLLGLINRVLFTLAVLAAVFLHGSLAIMGVAVAAVHLLTGVAGIVAWRRLAGHIRVSLAGLDRQVLRQMTGYCSTLAIWTTGMLCVSGLDVTIVGHFDYAQTAFYSIATAPTNLMLAVMGAALGPLMPAASALSVHRTGAQMGQVLARVTRYSTILLVLSGLVLVVCGFPLLRAWAGSLYAQQSIGYLRILVLANLIRNLCMPYASILMSMNRQNVAIAAATAEATVNLSASIYLARHIGAAGVAYGTLLGAFVSVGMHFAVSMHSTQAQLAISRVRLLRTGILRPLTVAIPSLLLFGLWRGARVPAMHATVWIVWASSTFLFAWYLGLQAKERTSLVHTAQGRLRLSRGTIE